ncbi:hypothetical protein JW935_21855 [candidate division KSB1 bacterium]|nr:hypothetical protein [candidate division KSB1 bacterium]
MNVRKYLYIIDSNLAMIRNKLGDKWQEFTSELNTILEELKRGNINKAKSTLRLLFIRYEILKELLDEQYEQPQKPVLRGAVAPSRQIESKEKEKILAQHIIEGMETILMHVKMLDKKSE